MVETLIQVPPTPETMRNARELASAVAILSAMITPAVLISACGSLAISTANRLGRTIDRVRRLSDQFTELAEGVEPEKDAGRRAMLFDQLARATRRTRLLQRAMTRIYLAISVFVATSVAIGIVAVTGEGYAWIPITLGLGGAALLFHASVLLIAESQVQLGAVSGEMDFVWQAGRRLAPSELVEEQDARKRRRSDWWLRS